LEVVGSVRAAWWINHWMGWFGMPDGGGSGWLGNPGWATQVGQPQSLHHPSCAHARSTEIEPHPELYSTICNNAVCFSFADLLDSM
jgi:hypothetical protein